MQKHAPKTRTMNTNWQTIDRLLHIHTGPGASSDHVWSP